MFTHPRTPFGYPEDCKFLDICVEPEKSVIIE